MKPKASTILKAPGEGLLTVTTGSGAVEAVLGQGVVPSGQWQNILSERLKSIKANKHPFLLGVPSDAGGGICRGAAHGPLHLRKVLYTLNPEWREFDLGDIPCIPQLLSDSMLSNHQKKKCGKALWGENYKEVCPVSPLDILREVVDELYRENPNLQLLCLGGDHSISGPLFESFSQLGLLEELAVLHIDAHTDLMEHRFGIDHCFATWTSHALSKMPDPSRWVQIGIRASRNEKKVWEDKFGLRQIWARECNGSDPSLFADHLIDYFRSKSCKYLYISNDIDGTDSNYAFSTGTPEAEGLKPEWLEVVIQKVSQAIPLLSADMVEVAPHIGSHEQSALTLDTCKRYFAAMKWK